MKSVINILIPVGMLLTSIEFVKSNIAFYSNNSPELAGRIGNSGTVLVLCIAILYFANTKKVSN